MWRRSFLVLFMLAAALTAHAAGRPFPATAKRGTMTPAPYPEIVIDSTLRHLAPGARIWNAENLIEMPAALRGSDFTVNYTENDEGDIDRVWILSDDEAREPLARQTTSLTR